MTLTENPIPHFIPHFDLTEGTGIVLVAAILLIMEGNRGMGVRNRFAHAGYSRAPLQYNMICGFSLSI